MKLPFQINIISVLYSTSKGAKNSVCGGNGMFVLSGILNIVVAFLFAWWSFGVINNILLLIPAVVFLGVGIMSIMKAVKK